MPSVVNRTLIPGSSFAWQNANWWVDPIKRATIFERFWKNVNRAHAKKCWFWVGYVSDRGYGVFGIGNHPQVRVKAHRFAWLASRGDIPEGQEVCHRCDVPQCVNPDHLFLGSHRDNVLDSVRKGRKRSWGLQKLNAEQVYDIRARLARGELHYRIAADYGIARNTVTGIANWKSWAHLAPCRPVAGNVAGVGGTVTTWPSNTEADARRREV